jgi:predicted metal-dependent peptidase
MATNTNWDRASVRERINAANYDCMRHPEFSVNAGVIALGEIAIIAEVPEGEAPMWRGHPAPLTAATDGENVCYYEPFLRLQNRKQTRAIILHETFHKALKHCLRIDEMFKRANPELTNIAMDFVVNGWIFQADPTFAFFDWWEGPAPLLEPKYFNWSVEQIINDLMKRAKQQGGQKPKPNQKPQGADGKRGSSGKKTIGADDLTLETSGAPMDGTSSMDGHAQHDGTGKSGKEPSKAGDRIEEQIDGALRQGKILSNQLRSKTGTGGKLDMDKLTESTVRWQDVLLEFMQQTIKGAEMARWSRINARIFAAAGVVLPTLYDERMGELVIAADTSGSMVGYYPLVFGETARICKLVKPEKVRIVWWDTRICSDQEFMLQNYDTIAQALLPAGGGGTEPSVVYDWLIQKQIKPQCVVYVTDGYIGDEPANRAGCPVLWCVINNRGFRPITGKVVYIDL